MRERDKKKKSPDNDVMYLMISVGSDDPKFFDGGGGSMTTKLYDYTPLPIYIHICMYTRLYIRYYYTDVY